MSSPSILRNRNFLYLWSGNGISLLGTSGVRLAYPLIVLAVTGSPALAGWVTFAASLPALLFQIPAGVIADYRNRRQTMLACQTIGLLATGAALSAVVWDLPGLVPILMIAAFVEGTCAVVFSLAEVGAIRDVVTDAQRPAAFSFLEAEQPIAILLGRAVGAAIFGVARWLPFALNAVSYTFCLVTLLTVPAGLLAPRPQADERTSPWRRVGEGMRWVWATPFLRTSTMMTGLTNIIIQAVILLVIVTATQNGQPAWVIGAILAAAGAGGVAGSFAASWLTNRYPSEAVYVGGLWAWAVLLLPIAASGNPYVLAVAWAGVGAVGTVSSVALTMARVTAVPDATLGRVVGAASMITDGAVPLGAVLAGYVLARWGGEVTGWVLFAVMLLLALFGSRFMATARHDSIDQASDVADYASATGPVQPERT